MILVFRDGFFLRQATAADHAALAMICLKTGDTGKDATGREDDPDLLGLVYSIPYQVLEPDLAFVVDGPTGVSGYLLGAADTHSFNARLATKWYRDLQARVADPGPDSSRWRGSDWARHRMPQNIGALNFYRTIGFEVLQDPELPDRCIYAVKRLGFAPDVAG